VALALFLLYSAWHFGQADFKEWNLKQGWLSFLWGIILLTVILFFHVEELSAILKQIPNLTAVHLLSEISPKALMLVQVLTISAGVILAFFNKSKHLLITLGYLLLASQLSLLMAFGIYFVLQHSLNGWKHLSVGLDKESSVMWKNALPFTIGGIGILIYFLLFAGENYIGIFFILLSCLSLPHVFSMHQFYKLSSSK
jgi:Brp/Blh family beta-carotene 15,15'-monooxygenase